ncbi:NAD(P)-dependent oxidoreductase [Planctomycetota bacterium]|nr:NAD(P)-dependent oxidoreductase [Planctomycetota bacterium]
MKILLTGASGMLGTSVAQALLASSHDVLAVDRTPSPNAPYPITICDLTDPNSITPLLKNIDAIVHLANIPHGYQFPRHTILNTNNTINANIFHAATQANIQHVLFASSVQVIAGFPARWRRKDLLPAQIAYLPVDSFLPHIINNNWYALSKYHAETMLQDLGNLKPTTSFIAIRFPWIYPTDLFHQAITASAENHYIDLFNYYEAFTYLSTTDAAIFIQKCLDSNLTGYHNFFPCQSLQPSDATYQDIIHHFYPHIPLKIPTNDFNSFSDITYITQSTGWTPVHPPIKIPFQPFMDSIQPNNPAPAPA